MSEYVYKICPRAAWTAACAGGVYSGSPDDARDGFIHFSFAEQLEATAAKHFAGQTDLVLIRVPREALGDALRLEASHGGALFPHLYGTLATGLATEVVDLPWDGTVHVFRARDVTA